MDFGIWVQNPNGSGNMTNNNQTQTPGQGDQQIPNGNANGGAPSRDGSIPPTDGDIFTHQVVHAGVVCDVCEKTITGFRYKCMQCRDYDLCSVCERRGLHAGHIMMRIAFPEMTAEALRRYIPQVEQAEGPRRPFSCGSVPHPHPHHGEHGHGGKHGHHGRREHHKGHCGATSSSDSSDEVKFPWGPGCPYKVGKKEIKKWAKSMKKTAHAHKRSAEAYANQTGAEGGSEGARKARVESENQQEGGHIPAFDFTAAASQIQEVLNAFGVPIDVVELYDEWGNTSGRPATAATGTQPQSGTTATEATANGVPQNPEAGTQQNLSDQLQQMNLGTEIPAGSAAASATPAETSGTTAAAATTTMEVEGEAGWTLLEADKSLDNTNKSKTVNQEPVVVELDTPTQTETIREIPIRIEPSSVPAAAATTETVTNSVTPPASSFTPTPPVSSAPAVADQRSIYPVLPPQLQQIMNGISNTVGNVTRRYGPAPAGFYPNPTATPWIQPPATTGTPHPAPPQQLNEQMMMTLHQLLGMGFSNHDGWLARLVASKDGNLDEVLNSLFPAGNNTQDV